MRRSSTARRPAVVSKQPFAAVCRSSSGAPLRSVSVRRSTPSERWSTRHAGIHKLGVIHRCASYPVACVRAALGETSSHLRRRRGATLSIGIERRFDDDGDRSVDVRGSVAQSRGSRAHRLGQVGFVSCVVRPHAGPAVSTASRQQRTYRTRVVRRPPKPLKLGSADCRLRARVPSSSRLVRDSEVPE